MRPASRPPRSAGDPAILPISRADPVEENYLISTTPPTSSIAAFTLSASSFWTPSFSAFGALHAIHEGAQAHGGDARLFDGPLNQSAGLSAHG